MNKYKMNLISLCCLRIKGVNEMFIPNTEDLQYLFESAGQSILINDTQQQAIITNPSLSNNEERFIHTLERVKMGDLVTFEDEKYLVMSETTSPRNGKYKARMRHCNHIIEIAGETIIDYLRDENGELILDKYGRPIEIEVETDPIFIPAIVDNQSFTIENGQFLVGDNKIIVTLQDNEVNQGKFEVNNIFELMGSQWKIRNVDKIKKGLFILTCERTV